MCQKNLLKYHFRYQKYELEEFRHGICQKSERFSLGNDPAGTWFIYIV